MLSAWSSILVVVALLLKNNSAASPHNQEEEECGVYFAESTIPGAGFGMFAGKHFQKSSVVTEGDISVPLLEMQWHNNFVDMNFLWEDYVWNADGMTSMDEEIAGDSIEMASFGIGAAANCYLSLVNVVDSHMRVNNAGLHRSRDAGSGAFTPYHDRKAFATKDIEPGAELFIDYGENYFDERKEIYGNIPSHKDYERADELIQKYTTLMDNLRTSNNRSVSYKLQQGLWSLVTTKWFGDNSRTLNALPQNVSEIEHAIQVGTSQLFYNSTVRSLEWLEQHGKCMDNIRPGLSKIPQAGRGAFATRNIPKGDIVAPVPLIHIHDRNILKMYDSLPETPDGKLHRNESAVVHQQLLLNYCFGHAESTLLLSPYGVLTSLVNHNHQNPNVRIQWSDTMRHPEWKTYSVDELKLQQHAGLVFDFVALQDIKEGDEIVMDYGRKWEDAWNAHVTNWKPETTTYQAAYELNDDLDMPLWPYNEKPYYSPNILVWVHGAYYNMAGLKSRHGFYLARIVQRNADDTYNVEVIHQHLEAKKEQGRCTETVSKILFDVPRDGLYFEDVPYTRDHYMFSSFRHEIMIPDDMFPEAWKNLL